MKDGDMDMVDKIFAWIGDTVLHLVKISYLAFIAPFAFSWPALFLFKIRVLAKTAEWPTYYLGQFKTAPKFPEWVGWESFMGFFWQLDFMYYAFVVSLVALPHFIWIVRDPNHIFD